MSGPGARYEFQVDGASCDAVLELSHEADEVYQGRVLISRKYDLLSFGQEQKLALRGLRVRLDSPDFELPFGRHGRRNEEILGPIVHKLRTEVLADYIQGLCRAYLSDELGTVGVLPDEVEDLCTELLAQGALLGHGTEWLSQLRTMPLFFDVSGKHFSLAELEAAVRKTEVLYIKGEETAGIDYGVFGAPVLSRRQPPSAHGFLETHFKGKLLALSVTDLVMEAPSTVARELSEGEERGCQRSQPTPQNLVVGLRLDHPFFDHLVQSREPNRAYYALTYVSQELAKCQQQLVPDTPAFHFVRTSLAADMRKGLTKNLLSADRALRQLENQGAS